MDANVFMDMAKPPTADELAAALGATCGSWNEIKEFVREKYPTAIAEWSRPGKKYGWSFRIKDKKRAIVYLLPRQGFFKAAFVFGAKATAQVLQSGISPAIKAELEQARGYAEGRGIRIDVRDEAVLADIRKLVEIKLAN
jgi:hypothetical protein